MESFNASGDCPVNFYVKVGVFIVTVINPVFSYTPLTVKSPSVDIPEPANDT